MLSGGEQGAPRNGHFGVRAFLGFLTDGVAHRFYTSELAMLRNVANQMGIRENAGLWLHDTLTTILR